MNLSKPTPPGPQFGKVVVIPDEQAVEVDTETLRSAVQTPAVKRELNRRGEFISRPWHRYLHGSGL